MLGTAIIVNQGLSQCKTKDLELRFMLTNLNTLFKINISLFELTYLNQHEIDNLKSQFIFEIFSRFFQKIFIK